MVYSSLHMYLEQPLYKFESKGRFIHQIKFLLNIYHLYDMCKIVFWRECALLNWNYRMRQIIRGEKLLQFLQIFANHECFTIENFPWISVPSTNYTKHGTTWS